MNITVAALLGLTMAQPPGMDYYPLNVRNITLPIEYKKDRAAIGQIQLFVSSDRGQTWALASSVLPDQEKFVYVAPKDGLYWFHIVIVDRKGGRDPANLTVEPPAMKVLVDTTRPFVSFTNVKRNGEEVVIEWKVEDGYPNEGATKVYFRPVAAGPEEWREVTLPAGPKNGVRFPTKTTEPVIVKVMVADLAGNSSEGQKEVPGPGSSTQTTVSMSPGGSGAPGPVPPPPSASGNSTPTPPVGTGVIPPPDSLAPVAPGSVTPPPSAPPPPASSVASSVPPPTPPAMPPAHSPPPPVGSGGGGGVTSPVISPLATTPPPPAAGAGTPAAAPPGAPAGSPVVPTFDPRNSTVSTVPAGGLASTPPPPPSTGAAAAPSVELTRAQVINTLRFDLNYQVEHRGPSGISRLDLWVTRDDGRSWVWWSQHNGQESAVKVNLSTATNTRPEGLYGFRIVPVSGAGLSEASPTPGDAPDIRVVVDVTAPDVKVLPPVSDASSPDALVLQWEATDQNFGDDPIALEWSNSPTGPWRPVVEGDGVVQVGAVSGVAARRLPNTGRYPWRVPTGLPPRIYLKVTARDAAGNTTERVTREPLLIDLAKPRAKITGIGASPVVRP